MAIGVKVMKRPGAEVSYLRATLKGMALTLSHLWRPKVTMQYPEEKSSKDWTLAPRWRRHAPHAHRRARTGQVRSRAACAPDLPGDCIKLVPGEDEQGNRYPLIYEIDEFAACFAATARRYAPRRRSTWVCTTRTRNTRGTGSCTTSSGCARKRTPSRPCGIPPTRRRVGRGRDPDHLLGVRRTGHRERPVLHHASQSRGQRPVAGVTLFSLAALFVLLDAAVHRRAPGCWCTPAPSCAVPVRDHAAQSRPAGTHGPEGSGGPRGGRAARRAPPRAAARAAPRGAAPGDGARAGAVARARGGAGDGAAVARPLFGAYLVPFEITSILLLAAIVGAVGVASRKL